MTSPAPFQITQPSLPPPPPSRPRAPTSLVVLATLAVGYTLWAAQAVILPVMLAAFFALVGNPIIRLLRKLHLPRFLAALMVLALGVAAAVTLTVQLAGPAAKWFEQAPSQMRQISRQVQNLTQPVLKANQAAESFARAAGGEPCRIRRHSRLNQSTGVPNSRSPASPRPGMM